MAISAAQCRAARALLDWSQERLAQEAGVGRATIADFERGARQPLGSHIASISSALELGGVEFLAEGSVGVGVRLRKPEIEYERDFVVDGDGVTLHAKHRGRRYKFRVGSDVLDDLIRGQCVDEEEMRQCAIKFLPLIVRAGELAIERGEGGSGYVGHIYLDHDHFDQRVF